MLSRFVLLLAALAALPVLAFDKEAHVLISDRVIEQYNRCAMHLSKEPIGEADAKDIAHFSEMEDESPLIQRALNWHFYDELRGTDRAMPNRLWLARTHLHHIYDVRVADLKTAISAGDAAGIRENTGRVIHYIEDMAVPAHTAPIYHAKPGNWFQAIFVADEGDAFDTLPMDYTDQLDYQLPLTECEQLAEPEGTLQEIMEGLAENTRKRVTGTIPVNSGELQGKTYEEVFWQLRKQGVEDNGKFAGFMAYGTSGNTGFDPKGSYCAIEDSNHCLDFFRAQVESLIHAGVRAMFLIESLKSE